MFDPEGWQRLIKTLTSKTREGKVDWTDTSEPLRGSLRSSSLQNMVTLGGNRPGEFVASVGSNMFKLGSSDADGREPFFIEVVRNDGPSAVVDSLRSDTARMDPALYRAGDSLRDLYKHVQAYARARGRIVESIISDLDAL